VKSIWFYEDFSVTVRNFQGKLFALFRKISCNFYNQS